MTTETQMSNDRKAYLLRRAFEKTITTTERSELDAEQKRSKEEAAPYIDAGEWAEFRRCGII